MRQIQSTEQQYQAAIEARDKEINDLRAMLSERNLAAAESDQALARDDEKNVALKQQVEKLNTLSAKLAKFLQQMLESKSWKMTKLLRNSRALSGNSEEIGGDAYIANFIETTKKELAQSKALLAQLGQNDNFVPLLRARTLKDKPVRLICFYRPQLPANPNENQIDEKASHEVLNVQPEIPGDGFGLHSLNNPNILRHQAELADLYGIEAFCFYGYLQDGNQHLQQALQKYLEDDGIKLKFCLCWDNGILGARNENHDSKINLQHCQEKIIRFIRQVADYLNNDRYLRVGERPLLIISNPTLFADGKGATAHLRQWCKDNGIGEIYLACLQTEKSKDSTNYGFDAAFDFAMNQMQLADLAGKAEYSGNALYSTVRPLKENASQHNEMEKNLADASPRHYQEQLYETLNRTTECYNDSDRQLVFIDAWNESTETQLEPGLHNGYAYLEATRMALVRKAIIENQLIDLNNPSVAVVIHAFYEEIFDEILGYLAAIHTTPLKLYVTTPIKLFEVMQSLLRRQQHDFYLLPVSNRGRDILPFLKIMPEVLKAGHEFLVKIHTKKSTHREDGDKWRGDIFEKLLTQPSLRSNLEYLRHNPGLGILGPSEHIVPLPQYIGVNEKRVERLAARLGVASNSFQQLNFVAGTMFTARTKAIIPLMNIALDETDFEAEGKQIDGTLAHALERLFAVSAFSVGLTVSSPDNTVTSSYQFVNSKTDKSKPKG